MPPAPNATMPSLDDRLPEHLDQDCSSDDFNEGEARAIFCCFK